MADSLTWKVPANASRGSTCGSRSRGSRCEQHVELELRALGGRLGLRLAEQPREHGRARPRPARARPPPSRRPSGPRRSGSIAVDLVAGADLGARLQRGARERVGERAHAADGHVPVALAVADHVVEEAAVLAQRRLVRGRERPDQPVGEHDPAHEVVGEGGVDRLAERALEQRLPGGVLGDLGAQLVAARERLGERGEDAPADARGHRVEARQASCGAASVRTSSPLPSGRGVYEEIERRRSSTPRPRSRAIASGSSQTR